MKAEDLKDFVVEALDDIKAQEVLAINVEGVSNVTDYMVVASGTSNRHAKSCAAKVIEALKEQGIRPIGVEGEEKAEWVLVDLGDVVVHIMLPEVRSFYDVESLWQINAQTQEQSQEQNSL